MQTIAYTNFDPDANRIIGMTNALWDIETSIDSRSSSAGGIPSTLTSTVFYEYPYTTFERCYKELRSLYLQPCFLQFPQPFTFFFGKI